MQQFKQPHLRQTRGLALIMALIFLLVLTILGVSMMQNTVLQERMAGNYAERNQAFQMAELAARTVERMHRDAVATGDVVPPSHTQDNWPSACPDIFDADGRYALGCSGNGVSANRDCLDGLSWQNIDTPSGSGSADYVVVPLDHVYCGTPEDQTSDSTDPFGQYGLGTQAGQSMILVMARGRGPANTGEAIVQTLYFGGALIGDDGDEDGNDD